MPFATITINNPTTPLDLGVLLEKGSQGGYVVVPANGVNGFTQGKRVVYLSVQASPTNGAGTYIYKGGENIAAGAYGKELAPGIIDHNHSHTNCVYLGEIYLTASQSLLKANIEFHWE